MQSFELAFSSTYVKMQHIHNETLNNNYEGKFNEKLPILTVLQSATLHPNLRLLPKVLSTVPGARSLAAPR